MTGMPSGSGPLIRTEGRKLSGCPLPRKQDAQLVRPLGRTPQRKPRSSLEVTVRSWGVTSHLFHPEKGHPEELLAGLCPPRLPSTRAEGKPRSAAGGGETPLSDSLQPPQRREGKGEGSPDSCRSRPRRGALSASSETPFGANIDIAPALLFQQTPEIYSVELSGTKDIVKTDKEDGKEKYRGLKNNCLERKKKNHKEEFQKELHLVSSLQPQGSCRLWPFPARAWP